MSKVFKTTLDILSLMVLVPFVVIGFSWVFIQLIEIVIVLLSGVY